MENLLLRPAEPARDFPLIATLFSLRGEMPETAESLRKEYAENKGRVFCLNMAADAQGRALGFSWAQRARDDGRTAYAWVIVDPLHRRKGAGRMLYEDLEGRAAEAGCKKIKVSVRDDEPDSLSFVLRRSFAQTRHDAGLALDLTRVSAGAFAGLFSGLEEGGIVFTSMERLGDTEEARRKLYALNSSAIMERTVAAGAGSWGSYEEFRRDVCESGWYLPSGQLAAVDAATGEWAAMSAVTRFKGSGRAWNLHTAVAPAYRGRGLARAMLAKAALFARDILGVQQVAAEEDAAHEDALAVYRALGYAPAPGNIRLEKTLKG